MAVVGVEGRRRAPSTPAKPIRGASTLQDSPFSDYFTDDAQSTNQDVFPAPSGETQQLLVRLHKLQARLMRGEGSHEYEALRIVDRKLSEIDDELAALHSQTRQPPDLGDSGLFMDDDEHGDVGDKASLSALHSLAAGRTDLLTPPATADEKRAEADFLILEAQRVLRAVANAHEELRERHREMKALGDAHIVEIEERDQQAAELLSENKGLKTELDLDRRELLSLSLQLKALEVEADALGDGAGGVDGPEATESTKRRRVLEDMKRWRHSWTDVDARFKRKTARRTVSSSDQGRHVRLQGELHATESDGSAWQPETAKKDQGRVESTFDQGVSDRVQSQSLHPVAEGEDGKATPPAATSTRSYTHRGMQTEFPAESGLFTGNDDDIDHENTSGQYDDCAITTSSEHSSLAGDNDDNDNDNDDNDDDDDNYNDRTERPATAPIKTAWQDLWEGLANLAGMSEDRFD